MRRARACRSPLRHNGTAGATVLALRTRTDAARCIRPSPHSNFTAACQLARARLSPLPHVAAARAADLAPIRALRLRIDTCSAFSRDLSHDPHGPITSAATTGAAAAGAASAATAAEVSDATAGRSCRNNVCASDAGQGSGIVGESGSLNCFPEVLRHTVVCARRQQDIDW